MMLIIQSRFCYSITSSCKARRSAQLWL